MLFTISTVSLFYIITLYIINPTKNFDKDTSLKTVVNKLINLEFWLESSLILLEGLAIFIK